MLQLLVQSWLPHSQGNIVLILSSTNPHNNKYSPGGSTGGEAALLAAGGGRIGIGSGKFCFDFERW